MSGIVERTDDPLVVGHHEMGDGPIAGAAEDEGVHAGSESNERTDRAAVRERSDDLVWVGGCDASDGGDGAVGQLLVGLGAGNSAPFALGSHGHDGRVAVGCHLAEAAAFAVAEMNLSEVGLDSGDETERLGQRCCRLMGALQTGDVERRQLFVAESVPNLLGLEGPER